MFCQVPTNVLLEVRGTLGEQQSASYTLRVDTDRRAELLAIEIRK
jgi:hypothetical protein